MVNKILATTVAGVLIVSSCAVFAAPLTNNFVGKKATNGVFEQGKQARPNQFNQEQMKTEMKTLLTSLVTDGTLTQAKSDALLTFLTTKPTFTKPTTKPTAKPEAVKGQFQGPFERAVTAGIITQAESDAINAKIQANAKAKRDAEISTKLQAIVDSGKITAEQKASVITALADEQTARKAEMDKVKAMTKDERTAYFKDNVQVSPIDLLIENKIITAQQAAFVKKAIGGERGNNFGMMNGKGGQFRGMQGKHTPATSTTPAVTK